MSRSGRGKTFDGSDRLANGSKKTNTREQTFYNLNKGKIAAIEFAEVDQEKFCNAVQKALYNECAIMVSKVYGGRTIRVKVFAGKDAATGEADTPNEFNALLDSLTEWLDELE